jgi:hypothetical protein
MLLFKPSILKRVSIQLEQLSEGIERYLTNQSQQANKLPLTMEHGQGQSERLDGL